MSAPRPIVLAPGIDALTARHLTERFANMLAAQRETACVPGAVVLFDGAALPDLAGIFDIPGTIYVDVALDHHVTKAARSPIEPQDTDTLCLSITTKTLYAHDISGPIAARLGAHLGITGTPLDNIRLAIQEALGNAALHGNLGLPSACVADMDMLERHSRLLQEALADPVRVGRAVCLRAAWDDQRLTLSVRDEGEGFDPSVLKEPDAGAICGRGIPLMRQLSDELSFTDDGRTAVMWFCR